MKNYRIAHSGKNLFRRCWREWASVFGRVLHLSKLEGNSSSSYPSLYR